MIGRRYAGFPDERWLDVSRFRLFERPLKQRFAMCARKGFDAVEPDNLAGWEPENHTGFGSPAPTSFASTAGSRGRSTAAAWRWR